MIVRYVFILFLIYLVQCAQYESINKDIVFENVDRSADLSTQIAKILNKITVKNNAPNPVDHILYSINEKKVANLALLSAQVLTPNRISLKVTEVTVKVHGEKKFWKIRLNVALVPNEIVIIEVAEYWTSCIYPHPQFVTQKEKQLVRYHGTAHIYSPYKVNKLTTVMTLRTRNIESYTKIKGTTLADGVVTYGPYNHLSPFSIENIVLHYENNAPFVVIKQLNRLIEISHWGNIAVEESVDLVHVGAKLKGSFSRYDYQRESGTGQPSVKSFKTILPAAAVNVYYRDDIGNISTSYMRVMKDAVELELRPRFPLFGGWQTKYTMGYNIPSYEYLYYSESSDDYLLNMRLLDHLYDDMVVEQLTTKIVLPEGVHHIDVTTPYGVRRLPDELYRTYLDTRGRISVTFQEENLIENHIQDFVLRYKFSTVLMLQEPLLLVLALYAVFLLVIFYVRLDFSIVIDDVTESKMRVAGLCEKLMLHQDRRSYLYQLYDGQINKLKTNKDINNFLSSLKSINTEYKLETGIITELAQKIKPDAPDVYEKIQDIQKLDKVLKDLYTHHYTLYTDKLIPGKIGRSSFVDAENQFFKKKNELLETIGNFYRSIN